jgi:hypothetical protein
MLPDFLIIGAYKAGTTSLHSYLGQHPQIHMSAVKETRYLTWRGQQAVPLDPLALRAFPWPVKTLPDYEAQFEGAVASAQLCGETSPCYLAFPRQSIRGIKAVVPEAKLIVVLREPVARAYSSFLGLVRNGREECFDFHRTLEYERDGVTRRRDGSPRLNMAESFYFESLSAYFEHFPTEQILVCLYEDWDAAEPKLLTRVLRFLGVDDRFQPAMDKRLNRAGWPRSRRFHRLLHSPRLPLDGRARRVLGRLNNTTCPPMRPEDRVFLQQLFREDVLKTQALVGRDLSAWLG